MLNHRLKRIRHFASTLDFALFCPMSKRRPRSRYAGWISAALLIALLILGMRAALPVYQRMRAIEAIERAGGWVDTDLASFQQRWWRRFIPSGLARALAGTTHITIARSREGVTVGHGGLDDLLARERISGRHVRDWTPHLRSLSEVKSLDPRSGATSLNSGTQPEG
jgi:hypothetical protein